jgi:hypothetical protein
MMPNTVNTYTGDGVLTDFTISFTYLDEDYINFTVENEIFEDVTENYTGSMFDPSTFRFTVAIPNNYRITFKRVTDINNDMFGWESGAVIRPADLSQTLKRLKDYSEENADQTIAATVTAESDAISSATTQSAASAAAAASSASAASSSASAAASSASAAATSETNAGTSEANAASSATAASTSETNAATSATNSAASAATAATQATNAATEATNAAASASAAATSETNAAASESAVTTIQTNMVALKDELLGIYLGAHVDDATANAHAATESYTVDTGDLYFDTTSGRMKVYNGSAWVGVASSIDATNASNSATDAETAQAAAEAALAALLNKFHGSFANDAAVESDITGDPALTLEAGDQYFNTTTSRIRYYDGSSWYDAAATQVIDTSALGNVGDVTFTSLTAGDLIKRVGSEWVNVPSTDFATAAQGTLADNALPAASYTAADVKTKYESNADTNAFTDAEKTKLSGIETGATADQTGAEIKALYEAEANAFTDAQFTKLSGIETGATTDQTGAEIKTALFAESDTNNLTDARLTTLNNAATTGRAIAMAVVFGG